MFSFLAEMEVEKALDGLLAFQRQIGALIQELGRTELKDPLLFSALIELDVELSRIFDRYIELLDDIRAGRRRKRIPVPNLSAYADRLNNYYGLGGELHRHAGIATRILNR